MKRIFTVLIFIIAAGLIVSSDNHKTAGNHIFGKKTGNEPKTSNVFSTATGTEKQKSLENLTKNPDVWAEIMPGTQLKDVRKQNYGWAFMIRVTNKNGGYEGSAEVNCHNALFKIKNPTFFDGADSTSMKFKPETVLDRTTFRTYCPGYSYKPLKQQ